MRLEADRSLSPLSITRRVLWSAAAALFGVLLFSLSAIDHVPAFVSGFFVALAVGSAWRPAVGLTLTMVLVPVATWIGRTWDGSIAWPEAVALAFLLGYAVDQARATPSHLVDNLTLAIHMAIVVVCASLSVHLLVLHGTIGTAAFFDLLGDLATGGYFVGNGGFASLDAAMRLVEGLLLAHAGASIAASDTAAGRRLIVALIIGAAAAGALNVWRVWMGALRLESPVAAFLRYLVTLRYNAHYGDVNAAGSYFVMALLPALALMRTTSVGWWILPTTLIVVSLSLSGSRAALLGGALGAGVVWLLHVYLRGGTTQSPTIRNVVLVAAGVVLAAATMFFALVQRGDVVPASTSLRVRVEFARASFDMLSTRPLFGVGVGQFPDRLAEFSTPELKRIYPVERENAHNNFLQILAELGIAGFAAIAAVLGIAASRTLSLIRAPNAGLVERATAGGVLAFVVTWLTGHPLLVDAPAITFWTMLGVIAGLGFGPGGATAAARPFDAVNRARDTGPFRWVAAGVILALLASMPVRAQHELGSTQLEHMAIGVSPEWRGDDEVPYRSAGHRFALFLQTSRVLVVPMRATVDSPTVLVDLRLGERLIDRVEVSSTGWRRIRIVLPDSGRAFERVQFVVTGSEDTNDEVVRVGKAVDLGPAF